MKTDKKCKMILYNKTLFGKEPYGITNGFITLKEVPNVVVDKMVIQYHYSHKPTQNRFTSFLVNKNMGFMQLGYGIRPHMKHTISELITYDNYCEFDRMWLSDELPKYSESQCIGLLLTYMKIKYPRIHFIITYADGSMGNKGIIYRATNAIFLGKIPVDFYVLPDGERIHPVSMYHRHKTRAWSFLKKQYPGIKHIKGETYQYRFLYILNRGMRKRFQERNAVEPQQRGRGSSGIPLHKKEHNETR